MVERVSSIGSYTTDSNLFEASDTRSNNIQICQAADKWRPIIPHLMEYLSVFIFTHTGHSVERREANIRVVRVPRVGTSAYFLVLGVAAQSLSVGKLC